LKRENDITEIPKKLVLDYWIAISGENIARFRRGERKREESPRGKRYIQLHADCVHNRDGNVGERRKKK